MAAGKYTVTEVEDRTGVAAATLRQWERRYGVPKPERSDSGYRLYSDDDLRHIRDLKAYVDDGVPASRAAEMVRSAQRAPKGPRPIDDLKHELVGALTALDEAHAERVLSEAFALHSVDAVVLELLHGAMTDIGTMWHDGTIVTTTEHFASAYVLGRLRTLMNLGGNPRGGRAVIVACAPSDQHEIGAMIAAVMLRRKGYTVYYVGANTPVEDLATMARDVRPLAVMISASSIETVQHLLAKRAHLRGMAEHLVLGGNGFNADPGRADALGGLFLGETIGEALERFEAMLAGEGDGIRA